MTARRTGRRSAVALLVAVLALLVVPTAPAPARPVAGTPQLAVDIAALSPVSASNGATLTVRGTVRNTGTSTVPGVALRRGAGAPVAGRAGLLRDLADPPGLDRVLADNGSYLAATALAPGASTTYAVAVPLGTKLDRGVISVYPLAVQVRGSSEGTEYGTLGEADTFLPYVQQSVASPLRVSWVVPLDPAPVQAANGTIDDASFPTSVDSGGALARLLAASTPPAGTKASGAQPGFAPVTYAVEPSLLDATAATADDGWRRTGDPTSGDGRNADPGSAAFLAALAARTNGGEVLALPYADPDAAALAHAGLGQDLSTAVATGRSDLDSRLPAADVLSGVGWLPGDGVDQATLTAYASAGVTTLVLPGGQLPAPDTAVPPTQSAVTTLDTTGPSVRGLVTDPDLEALLGRGGHEGGSDRMSAQRLLALLAVTVGEAPNDRSARDVVLALPRGTDPSAGWLADALADTGTVPWLRAVALSATADDPTGERTALGAYPASARAAELPAATLTGAVGSVADLRTGVAALGSALPDTSVTRPLELALDRAESYAWRADPAGSLALRSAVARQVPVLLDRVQIAAAGTVTLASTDASIPVTVENGLSEPVTVLITLASTDQTKLDSTTQEVTVPAGRKQRVLLRARTQRAGTFRATIDVRTPSGRQISRTPFLVHSRAYGALTLVITLGALGVLLLAIVVRTVRRIRHRGGGSADPDGGTGPDVPSDPAQQAPIPSSR